MRKGSRGQQDEKECQGRLRTGATDEGEEAARSRGRGDVEIMRCGQVV